MARILIGFVFLALILGGCTRVYNAEVSRFHELDQLEGKTFIIAARNQADSVELKGFAGLINKHLKAQGYVPAGTDNPDFTVTIDYAVSEAVLEEDRFRGVYYSDMLYNGNWYGLGFWNGFDYTYPALMRRSLGYDSEAFPVYGRIFELVIETNTKRIMYLGTASSVGREKELEEFIPVLIGALFAEFPGESGKTQQVKIKASDLNGF